MLINFYHIHFKSSFYIFILLFLFIKRVCITETSASDTKLFMKRKKALQVQINSANDSGYRRRSNINFGQCHRIWLVFNQMIGIYDLAKWQRYRIGRKFKRDEQKALKASVSLLQNACFIWLIYFLMFLLWKWWIWLVTWHHHCHRHQPMFISSSSSSLKVNLGDSNVHRTNMH